MSCMSVHSGNRKSSKVVTPANTSRLQSKHTDAFVIPTEAKRKGEVRLGVEEHFNF